MKNLISQFTFEWKEFDSRLEYEQLKRINHASIKTNEGIIIFGGENSKEK